MHARAEKKRTQMPRFEHRRLFRRSGLAIALLAGLAACALPENTLTTQQIAAMDINGISVSIKPGSNIAWSDAEEEFALSKGCPRPDSGSEAGDGYNVGDNKKAEAKCDYDALVNSPEARAHLEGRVRNILTATLEERIRDAIDGTKASRMEVLVKQVVVLSKTQGLILGGQHFMQTDMKVIDVATGATVVAFPDTLNGLGSGHAGVLRVVEGLGPDDPFPVLAAGYAEFMKGWLLNELE